MIQMTQKQYDALLEIRGRGVYVVMFNDTALVGFYSSKESAEEACVTNDKISRGDYTITLEAIQ